MRPAKTAERIEVLFGVETPSARETLYPDFSLIRCGLRKITQLNSQFNH